MGLLDRFHDAATGLGGALEGAVGLVSDIATSPLDNRGMVDSLYHDLLNRSGEVLGGTIGPQGFTGSLIGALPEPVRAGVNAELQPIEHTTDSLYRNIVAHPIAAAMTAASLSSDSNNPLGGDYAKFASASTWARAWHMSEHESPGQAIALAFMTKDIENLQQVAKAQGSDFYHAASGTVDALARWYLDPTTLALAGGTAYLKELHAIDGPAAIAYMERKGHVGNFVNDIMGRAAAAPDAETLAAGIRNDYFPKNYRGGLYSTILAQAATLGDASVVHHVTRVMMGSTPEIELVRAELPEVAAQLDRASQMREMVAQTPGNGWDLLNGPEDLARQEAEVKALYAEGTRLERLNTAAASWDAMPTMSPLAKLRSATTSSDWYQAGITAKPLRVVFQQAPKHLIQYDSAMSDATLWHFMQQSDMPVERQLSYRGAYLNAETNGARMAVAHAATTEAIQSIADSGAVDAVSGRFKGAHKFATWLDNVPARRLDADAKAQLLADFHAAKGRDAKLALLNDISDTHNLPLPGLSVNEMNRHLAEAATLRDRNYEILNTRKYDGEGRSVLQFEDENGVANHLVTMEKPLLETQLADLDALPDLRLYRQASSKVGQFRMLHPTTDLPALLARNYYDIWKPLTLWRVGFPVRVVTDEGLRVAAKVGALNAAKMLGSGTKDLVKDTAAYMLGKAHITDWKRSSRGMDEVLANDHALQGVFGPPGDGANIYKSLSRARDTFGRDVVTAEGGIYDELKRSGDWKSFVPTDTGYGAAWQRDVNFQIGSSKLAKHMLEAKLSGLTHEEAVRDTAAWLRASPDGQRIAREVGRTDLPAWADRVGQQVDAYLPTDNLKNAVLHGRMGGIEGEVPSMTNMPFLATEQMLRDEYAAHPEQFVNGNLPTVHGEVLTQDLHGGPVMRMWKNTVEGVYKNLVDKPEAYLIRNPFIDHMYQAEVRRQIQLLTGEREHGFAERMARRAAGVSEQSHATNFAIGQEDIDRIQYSARQYALGETKNLLHNFSEQSRMGEMLRFVVPFYSAWSQILSRWAGLAVENPAFMRRMDMLWRAPERAGVVTDGKGNLLGSDDTITHAVEGGPWKVGDPAADSERNITLPIPKWAKDVPLVGAIAGGRREMRFGKDTFNLLLHGFPTLGPLGQVPLNEIAKNKPELADSLKWAVPYVSQNSLDVLKPTIVKHLSQQAEGDANRSYAYTVLSIFNDKSVDFHRGLRATPPTWKEAEDDAKSFEHVKNLASFSLPFSAPQFVSPYQPYIDSYRARLEYDGTLSTDQKQDPNYLNPKEWFLQTYGPDFFALTTSMSKSIDGVPPTLAGFKLRQEHADLIGKYPELGGLIAGAQGAGAFSQAVYDSQFQTDIAPGQGAERQVRNFKDFEAAPKTELGWIYFSKTMDQIDALRVQRGLPSLNVKAAADLAAMKKNLVYNLAQQYPDWFQDYMSTDATKWDQRINGMTAIVNTKGMTDRPEMAGLEQYLQGRSELVSILDQAQSHTLSAQANSQLSAQWDQYVAQLVAENPAFAALYYRWLQNDPVTVTPLTQMATAGTL